MQWGSPPKIKIYEALGALADGRVEIISENEAQVFSSSGGKFYTVRYDPEKNAIMSNDNGSYWQGYLGYPAIAFLLEKGILPNDERLSRSLSRIPWKDINTRVKNDYEKTLAYVRKHVSEKGIDPYDLEKKVAELEGAIARLGLNILGKKEKPPAGY